VIGGTLGIHLSLFKTGDTLASRIAAQYQGAASNLQIASLVYLAVILLAISLVVNLAAQLIVRRFELQRAGGS
jgi:phosphate transport system permease protein